MIKIENKELCCSCQACFNICPKGAILMKEDVEGFKYPLIDKSKCIGCNLCEKVCPILNRKNSSNKRKPDIYAAWSKSNEIRIDSTSGGIFTELAKVIYQEKGMVCAAIYNEDWMVEHYLSSEEKDLDNLRSSKYLQSDIGKSYSKIKNALLQNKKVLFCGSPCQVAGLYGYLQKDYEKLITVDFICRGMNSPKIFKKYLKTLEQKYKSKVTKIKFKNKINGWHNFSTKIDFEDGKTYVGGRYTDSYMVGYLKYNTFMRPSCYDCKFKQLPRKADITLADFWGIEKIDKSLDEDKGTSMILINSSKGEELFEKIKAKIIYKKIISEEVFNENICIAKSPERKEARDFVFKNIDKLSYEELQKKYFPAPNFLEKVKIKIKNSKVYKKMKEK